MSIGEPGSENAASIPPLRSRRNHIWFCAGPLVVLGCLTVVVANPLGTGYVTLGYLFGTIFGHASLAAAWTAFGPLRLVWRLPLSLLWLLSLTAAVACNVWLHGGPDEVTVTMAGCLVGQFALLQIPFWGLAVGYGLRLRHCEITGQSADRRELQFGIRELMLITTIAGVVLGLGRLAIAAAPSLAPQMGRETPIFIFLAAAAIVTSLPLVLAGLLPRLAVPAVIMAMVFIGLTTAAEMPLLGNFHTGPGPVTLHIISINAFTAGWILCITAIVRISGYRLGRR